LVIGEGRRQLAHEHANEYTQQWKQDLTRYSKGVSAVLPLPFDDQRSEVLEECRNACDFGGLYFELDVVVVIVVVVQFAH